MGRARREGAGWPMVLLRAWRHSLDAFGAWASLYIRYQNARKKAVLRLPAPVVVWRSSSVMNLAHDLVLGKYAGSQMIESGMQRQKEEL